MSHFPRFVRDWCVGLVLVGAAGCTQEIGELPTDIAGSCLYTNRFSDGDECRDYLGPWKAADAKADCEGQDGNFSTTTPCDIDAAVGACALNGNSDTPTRIAFRGGSCAENKRGCEVFGGGVFLKEGTCGDGTEQGPQTLSSPFPEPELACVEPLDGEPEGTSAEGQVCQWISMQGCTEPGRKWEDYASCEVPREQRPYYFVEVNEGATDPDPRLDDPEYASELAWVKGEVEACSCVCCHSTSAPEGPGNWYLEQEGNFINGFFDSGIAQGAGIIDSSVLGALPAEDNNGFTRLPSIFPSTDPVRMQRFFQAEFEHRGLTASDFEGQKRYGPLSDQQDYVPEACSEGRGLVDGKLQFGDADVRILYVLEAGSANPGVPPNLDTPEGTLWRIDADAPKAALIASGVSYGQVPNVAAQRFPTSGAPAALVPGQTYYLVALADYVEPVERCLFVAP